MGNDTSNNPWIIDTASSTAITTDLVRVRGIRWVGASTAAHAATIKDKNAKVVWDSVASGANYVESDLTNSPPQGWNWQGLAVTALGSGKLYIEFL